MAQTIMKITKMHAKAPEGSTIKTITYPNGIKKLVARSSKPYNSPKIWNGNKWITIPR